MSNRNLSIALLILTLAFFYWGYTIDIPDPKSKPLLGTERGATVLTAGSNSIAKYILYTASSIFLIAAGFFGYKTYNKGY